MKPTNHHASRQTLADVAHRLHLGKVFEEAHGAGMMTTDSKHAPTRAGWTLTQLMAMSEAKSLYN